MSCGAMILHSLYDILLESNNEVLTLMMASGISLCKEDKLNEKKKKDRKRSMYHCKVLCIVVII